MRTKTKAKLKNYIALVLDRSSSMWSVHHEAVEVFNNMVATARDRGSIAGQETQVMLVTFADTSTVDLFPTAAERVKSLTENAYSPDGMTALFDGVGEAIRVLERVPDADEDNVSFLLLVITDGEENNSCMSHKDFARLLKRKQNDDRWTLTFQLPPGQRTRFSRACGVPEENIREWEATSEGTQEASQATTSGLTDYFTQRTIGAKSVKNFYKMTTNLPSAVATAIKTQLTDIRDEFRVLTVDAECSIKEFVEAKTKKGYVVGSAYYQLTKPEKVQPFKSVCIMEKGKKAVWGGKEARDIIGLPDNMIAKVTPGNHGNLDIYVSSTSTNRKLVRGTKLLLSK